ncbi:MAG: hypothetical protein IPM82_11895 [Saprospiraceae bacterium]|nr:hypothetical protein [Saprospiraceae bacterium]
MIQLKGRFNDLERDVRQNTISFDNANLIRAGISKAILSLIDELPNGGTTPNPLPQATNPPNGTPTYSTGTGDGKVTTGTGDGGTNNSKIPLWIGIATLIAAIALAGGFPCVSALYVITSLLAMVLLLLPSTLAALWT